MANSSTNIIIREAWPMHNGYRDAHRKMLPRDATLARHRP